jgi:hypothetical protein
VWRLLLLELQLVVALEALAVLGKEELAAVAGDRAGVGVVGATPSRCSCETRTYP